MTVSLPAGGSITYGRDMELLARHSHSSDQREDQTRLAAETTQPRPALGRRPWFALLRRARSLRRFALAMAGRLPDGRGRGAAVVLATADGSWVSPPLALAAGMRTRLAGLRPWSAGSGLLMAGGAAHGCGMVEPLTVTALDAAGHVLAVLPLPPRRLVRVPGAAMLVETAATHPAPPLGAVLVARPILGGWPVD